MTEDQLEALIGVEVAYSGRRLLVVDWIAEGPALVLREIQAPGRIQDDQFGEARRRAPATWTVPVYGTGDTDDYHPLLKELGLI